MVTRTVQEVAEYLKAEVIGDGKVALTGIAPIEEAGTGQLSFVANPKYVSLIDTCTASALITSPKLDTIFKPRVLAANPYLAFTRVMHLFMAKPKDIVTGISPLAVVHEEAEIASTASIMENVFVGRGARVGEHTIIEPGVVIGDGATVGDDCYLEANCHIGAGCQVDRRCIIHSGTQVGSSMPSEVDGSSGIVQLEEDVELGANVVIQGGTSEHPTRIGSSTKIDNLVNIGPECQIGISCILVSQVTLGQGVILGNGVTLAGQATVMDNCRVGNLAVIGAKSLVDSNVPDKAQYWGIPAKPHREERRSMALIHRIPKLETILEKLETEENR